MNADLEYAIGQLKLAQKCRYKLATQDCIQRALDAMERLREQLSEATVKANLDFGLTTDPNI